MHYEHLLAEPDRHVIELCDFLGLSYEDSMLRFFERPDGTPAKVLSNPRHARLAEPLSAGPRSWRTHMAPADLQRFEAVAGEMLARFGYERAVARPPVSARAAAAWGKTRWQASRGGARLPGRLQGIVRRPRPR